jgi:hypothetical protein
MRHLSIIILFLSLSTAWVHADLKQEMLSVLTTDHGSISKLLKENAVASLQFEVRSNDPAVSTRALLAIWLLGESQEQIELVWWKSKSPKLRSLAATLLLTGNAENTANVPLLDPDRFNESERGDRARELKMIETEGRVFGGALKKLIMQTYDDNPNEWKSALRLKFATFQ